VLSNLSDFPSTDLAKRVADLYLSEEFTAPRPPEEQSERAEPPAPTELKLSADELDQYTGRYYSPELEATYLVHPVDGNLTYHFLYSPVDVELLPTGPDEWYAGRTQFTFLRDDDNRVTSLHVSLGRVQNIYFEKTR
jgi:hypothetical protein